MKLTPKQKAFADYYIELGNATEEIRNLRKYEQRTYQSKTYETFIRNFYDMKLYALKRLAKRYLSFGDLISEDLISECIHTISSISASREQKKACKIILEIKYGAIKANEMIEKIAIVSDRSDSLVNKWVKYVKERDKYTCQRCNSRDNLEAHHISHWSDDPINRVNVDNGITLCKKCHSEEHPEIQFLIRGGEINE